MENATVPWNQTKHSESYMPQGITVKQEMFSRFLLLPKHLKVGSSAKFSFLCMSLSQRPLPVIISTTSFRFLLSLRMWDPEKTVTRCLVVLILILLFFWPATSPFHFALCFVPIQNDMNWFATYFEIPWNQYQNRITNTITILFNKNIVFRLLVARKFTLVDFAMTKMKVILLTGRM